MIDSVKENLASNPEYGELCNKLGLLYTLKNHFKEARDQFENCLAMDPSDLDAKLNLAFLCFHEEKWGEAGSFLSESVKIAPESGLCHHALGVSLLIQGKREESIESFQRAAHLDSFYRFHYEGLVIMKGECIELTEGSEERLKEEADRLYLTNLHHFVAECYSEIGETPKAIEEYRKVIRIDSTDYKGYLRIGKLLDLQGEYAKAIEEFEKAAAAFPGCGAAYAYMSYAHAGLGDLKKALETLKKAVEIHPESVDVRYQLGLLYEDMDMVGEAIDALETALRVDPKYLFARINLGVLYDRVGETERALEEYEKVAELVTEDRDIVDRIDQLKEQAISPTHDFSNT
jgi:tetratricopeptide (TPR) repeat protein